MQVQKITKWDDFMETTDFDCMNTQISIYGLNAKDTLRAKELFYFVQHELSRFNPYNKLNILNHSLGRWCVFDGLCFDILQGAFAAYESSGGLFNPFLGKVLLELGYDKSFELLNDDNNKAVINTQICEQSLLEFRYDTKAVRINGSAHIDLGGYAKGWLAQYVFERFGKLKAAEGMVNAGGDLVVWGDKWDIGISHPYDTDTDLAVLKLKNFTAIATSNIVKRSWDNGQKHCHHIINPFTLQPVDSDLVQVTVLTDDLAQAEVYTKCMLVLGSESGIEWLGKKCPQAGYLCLTKDEQILKSW